MSRHFHRLFNHLIFAAFLAISLRFLAESDSALAFPPFNPPSLPNATAAGFFAGTGVACPVDCWTILKAVWFKSVLERLGMAQLCADSGKIQVKSDFVTGKLYHYRNSTWLANRARVLSNPIVINKHVLKHPRLCPLRHELHR
jgi:hypothetical protein